MRIKALHLQSLLVFIPRCISPKILLCIIFFFLPSTAWCQWTHQLNDLSSEYYRGFFDSLLKQKPKPVFEEWKKQKDYELLVRYHKYSFSSFLSGDLIVHDTLLENYLNDLLKRILIPNKGIVSKQPRILISRSDVPNAYNVGLGVIIINCGYIYQAQTEEDILVCLAHELGHFFAEDTENEQVSYINLVYSKTLRDSLKDIYHSRYKRFSRGEEVWKQYAFEKGSHSRYRETEADSTAAMLLRKAGFPFDANYFLRLDSMKLTSKMELTRPFSEAILHIGWKAPVELSADKATALSAHRWGSHEKDSLEFLKMKTHPDCKERYARTKIFSSTEQKRTLIPSAIKNTAYRHIIMYAVSHSELGEAMFLLMKDTAYNNRIEQQLLGQVIARKLIFAHRKMKRAKEINIVDPEYCSKDYNRLQTLLSKMPEQTMKEIITQIPQPITMEWQYALSSLDAILSETNHKEKHALSDAYPCSPLNEIIY